MLFYCFPRSGSLLTLDVRLQTAAETKSTLPCSKMWGHLENTDYLLAMYFNLDAVKNMGGIKSVYWWKVTYSIFQTTHGQIPVYSEMWCTGSLAGSDLSSTRVQSPQPLPWCCQFPCTELQIAQTVLHQCSCGACAQLAGSLLLHGFPVLVCSAISSTCCSCDVTSLGILVLTYCCAIKSDENYQSWRLNFLWAIQIKKKLASLLLWLYMTSG